MLQVLRNRPSNEGSIHLHDKSSEENRYFYVAHVVPAGGAHRFRSSNIV